MRAMFLPLKSSKSPEPLHPPTPDPSAGSKLLVPPSIFFPPSRHKARECLPATSGTFRCGLSPHAIGGKKKMADAGITRRDFNKGLDGAPVGMLSSGGPFARTVVLGANGRLRGCLI